jgi:hypothetical protein
MGHFSDRTERGRVRAYRKTHPNVGLRKVATIFHRSPGAVAGWCKGEKPTAHRSGRRHVLTQDQLVHARARMRGKHGVSAKGIAPTLGVHRTTVQRGLLRDKTVDNYFFLKKRRQGMLKGTDVDRRLAFAKKHNGGYMWRDKRGREHKVPWERVVFSDATIFTSQIEFRRGRDAPGTWDTAGQHEAPEAYVAHSACKAVVYGIITHNGVGPELVPCTGTTGIKSSHYDKRNKRFHVGLCGAEYAQEVLPRLVQQAKDIMDDGSGRRWVFMHDADRKHKAGEVYLDQEHVGYMHDWGAKLTEVNPIENVWAMIAYEKNRRLEECRTVNGLLKVLDEEWVKLNITKTAQKTHASVKDRLIAVINAAGGRTKY